MSSPQATMNASVRPGLLKTLQYFPIAGFLVKVVMDITSNNSMTAISSIVRDSCMLLYLGCMLWVLFSQPELPKLGFFVMVLLIGLYSSSVVLNSKYIQIIDSSNKENYDPSDATFWILAELFMLYFFMSNYISNLNDPNFSTRWLVGLLLVMIPHAWIIGNNLVDLSVKPTDEAKME